MGQLCRVIARAGTQDLGLRARHIKTIVEAVEPPEVMKLKQEASALLKRYGFYADYSEFNHLLGNYVGLLCERIGRMLHVFGRRVGSYRRLAAAAVAYLLLRHPDERMKIKAVMIMRREGASFNDLSAINCLQNCPWLRGSASRNNGQSHSD